MVVKVAGIMLQSSANYVVSRDDMPQMPDWEAVTIQEASEISGYNPEYLRRLARQGKIESVKVGILHLIRLDSLKAYVAEMQASRDARTGPRSPKAE